MEEVLRALGERIRQLRKNSGFTQEAFAEKIGLHGSYVGLIERGVKAPSIRTLTRIADFFNITLSNLLVIQHSNQDKEDLKMKQTRIIKALEGKSTQDLEKIEKIIKLVFD